jgi:predicted ATPase
LETYVSSMDDAQLQLELGSSAIDVARIVPQLRERLHIQLQPPGDPEEDRWRLFQSVVALLRGIATRHATVLVLEDLHDADRGTLDLLLHLARSLGRAGTPQAPAAGAGARLLVVGTYRDVEVDRAHPLSGALAELRRVGGFGRVPLRGLTPADVRLMLARIAEQQVPVSLAEAVYRQTEGNPLFVQEVLRYLAEEGAGAA